MATPFGIQLFSVRDSMEKDFEGTLKKLSEMGYTSVEFAGFYGKSAKEVKEILKRCNLTVSGTHSSFDDLLNNYDEVVAYHKEIGNKYYIMPGYDLSSQAKIDRFTELVNPMCERLQKDGITLAFHNHAKEFYPLREGSVAFEQLIYRTDLKFEVDTYWAYVGMGDPVQLTQRISNRVVALHVKDGLGDKLTRGTPLGRGNAPVRDVVALGNSLSIPMVVESETCYPDGLTEARISIDYLRSLEK